MITQAEKDQTMLDRVREARRLRAEQEQAFADTVREAMRERGRTSVREIAEAAGLSRERAYQLARGPR